MGRSVPISPLIIIWNQRVVVRSAARSQAPPAAAWRRAPASSPWAASHVAARRCSCGDLVGELRAQLGAQQLGEQRVVAMPGAALVERRREHAAVLQSRQHRVAVRRPGERVGELGAQRVDDRRAQQEVAQLRWLAREHLADEVVADRGVGAGEVLDEVARLGMLLQRHGREAQRRRPALGAPPERREVLGRERDAERAEQRAGLVQREARDRRRGSRSGCRPGAGGRARSAGPPA